MNRFGSSSPRRSAGPLAARDVGGARFERGRRVFTKRRSGAMQKLIVVMVGRRNGTRAGVGAYDSAEKAQIAMDAARAALQCTPMSDLEVWIEDEP